MTWNYYFSGDVENYKRATETFKTSQNLGISLTADSMKAYKDFEKELQKQKEDGVLHQITDMFRNMRKTPKW